MPIQGRYMKKLLETAAKFSEKMINQQFKKKILL
jgi:hypothetical protein